MMVAYFKDSGKMGKLSYLFLWVWDMDVVNNIG